MGRYNTIYFRYFHRHSALHQKSVQLFIPERILICPSGEGKILPLRCVYSLFIVKYLGVKHNCTPVPRRARDIQSAPAARAACASAPVCSAGRPALWRSRHQRGAPFIHRSTAMSRFMHGDSVKVAPPQKWMIKGMHTDDVICRQ